MKDYEDIVKALKCCATEPVANCDVCPYKESNCRQKDRDALKLIEERKAELEQPKIGCDYELTLKAYETDIRKLTNKLSEAEIAHERTQRELAEAQNELIRLRAIKATTEAFLGREI